MKARHGPLQNGFMIGPYASFMKRWWTMALLGVVAGCTFGAPSASNGTTAAGVMTIDISLTARPASPIAAGLAGGYAPATVTIPVGTRVQFFNSDSFAHSASSLGSGLTFTASSPLGAAALSQNGTTFASGWTSGNLTAGARSQIFLADTPGTYIYGCFYHYGAPMRGAIVVR